MERLSVLEITSPVTSVAGRLLADAGARVVKVESPGTRAPASGLGLARRQYQDTDKESLSLGLTTPEGAGLLAELTANFDILLESGHPGWLSGIGLGYDHLSTSNPALTVVSITPFGQTGPYSGWKADDLVAFAMGGLMFISGTPGRPPLVAPCEQAWMTAGVHAAGAALAGWWAAAETGRGEWVDVSMMECLAAQECTVTNFRGGEEFTRRVGSQHRTALPGRIFRCKDGYVHVFVSQDRAVWRRFVAWAGAPPELASPDLAEINERWRNAAIVDAVADRFMATKSREELFTTGQAHHLPVAPVYTVAEALADPHVRYLDVLDDVGWGQPGGAVEADEATGAIAGATAPILPPYRTLKPALRRGLPDAERRRAPMPGQDTDRLLSELLGMSREDCTRLRGAGVV